MAKRNIGQEILNSINEMKAGNVGRLRVYITAEQIKAIREKVGVSQSAFAAMMNVSMRTLQEWEQGRGQPNGPARALLAVAAKRPEVMQEGFTA